MDTQLTPRFVSNLAAPAVLAAVHSAFARGAYVEQLPDCNSSTQTPASTLADFNRVAGR